MRLPTLFKPEPPTMMGRRGLSRAIGGALRMITNATRAFDAAKKDRLRTDWPTTPTHINHDLAEQLVTIRTRSRYEMQNNPYAKRYRDMCMDHIVGPKGMTLRPNVILGSGKPDLVANKAIQESFKRWGRPDICHVGGLWSFRQIQRQVVSSLCVDGEAIIQKVHQALPDDRNPYRFALHLLDPMMVPADLNQELPGGHSIRMGIEYDEWGRKVNYWITRQAYQYTSHSKLRPWRTLGSTKQASGKEFNIIPAKDIYHIFVPEFAGQERGIPWLGTALDRLHQLKGYDEAALMAARVGAAKMGFFTSPDGNRYAGEEVEPDGGKYMEAEPASFEELPEGLGLQSWDPTYPAGEYPAFVKSHLRGIASGLGVNYNHLSGDLEGVNYTSLRAGFMAERDFWRGRQHSLIDGWFSPLYEDWLSMALLSRNIPLRRGSLDPLAYEKYVPHEWVPRAWYSVDPQKDTQAHLMAMEKGLRAPEDIINDLYAEEATSTWDKIRENAEQMSVRGINPSVGSVAGDIEVETTTGDSTPEELADKAAAAAEDGEDPPVEPDEEE